MIENFTIRAIYNKDHYHPANWLKACRSPSHFYVYEHGRWLCMLNRLENSTYRIISYSTRVSAAKISMITDLIEHRLRTVTPHATAKVALTE